MREASTKRIYDVQSAFYDVTFGRLVRRRIRRAIEHLQITETDLVLDLGIGTGGSLPFYPRRGRVLGIDLSDGMLKLAKKKILDSDIRHVRLLQANALELPFADNTFDNIFISHVISVVSDAVTLVREAQRVAKPNARIVVLNHFQSPNRLVAMIERWLNPVCEKIGWRSDLDLVELIRSTGMKVDYRFKLDAIDLWETVVVRNDKSTLAGADHGRALVPV